MASAGKVVETKEEKALRIKTGVVKRLKKELAAYEAEQVAQSEKIQRMQDEGKDEYDIRKQNEVLAETDMMIPDTRKRLTTAVDALQDFIDANEEALAAAAGLPAARELISAFSEPEAAGAAAGGEEDI